MKPIRLKDALNTWQAHHEPGVENHIPLERLVALSQAGGMKTASQEEFRHLSRCAQCLEQWELLCVMDQSREAEQDAGSNKAITGYGFLKAASSGSLEPLSLVSQCNRFILGIYFDPDESGNGMVTLDVSLSSPVTEKTMALVEDKNKKCVLKALLHDGRTARNVSHLDEFDFSKWTVTLSGGQGSEDG